jgi:hypothetical protein
MSDEPANAGPGSQSSKQFKFTPETLYSGSGPGERPRARDVQQTSLENCGFLATMGAIAELQPERIRDAITFDPKTGNFGVTVYGDNGQARKVLVSQADIEDNLARRGGSTLDDNPGRTTPVWPAVIETAVAKSRDTNHADRLDQGYQALTMWPRDAMRAITGHAGTDIGAAQAANLGEDRLHERLSQAIAAGRPVTLSTNGVETVNGAQDGLVDDHAYMVERAYKDKDGNLMMDLRNPWNQNNDSEPPNSNHPVIPVRYDDLVNNGGLNRFTIGPAPIARQAGLDVETSNTQVASTGNSQPTVNTGDASLNRLLGSMYAGTLSTGLQNFGREPDVQQMYQQDPVRLQARELERAEAAAVATRETIENPAQQKNSGPRMQGVA